MPSPGIKKSTAFIGTAESVCRMQRRKLARRHKSSSQLPACSSASFTNDHTANGRSKDLLYHHSALSIEAQPLAPGFANEVFLQKIVEACASNVAVLNENGQILYVSKPWRLLAEKYDAKGVTHPLDLNGLARRSASNGGHSNRTCALAADIQAILDGKITEFHNEYSCESQSGSNWFVVHAARLDLPGTVHAFRVLVNSSDITHARQTEAALRDLGGRLITAQEEERSRIARELHDDLNQRMALLSVELEQVSQRLPSSQGPLRLSINKVWERAQEISSEIHRVAYQLHPSKLDHLGLVAAVKSHCLELAGLHEIKIAFKEKGCHGLIPKDVTLCLFRIVQESFRNVIKHSGAREASVVLVGTPDVIQLSISDNGRGFDVDCLESRNGLGLISMRERLRLVGGVISIHSTSRGTKVKVSVPIVGSNTGSAEKSLPGSGELSYLTPLSLSA
jgi:signal transduction histidine kinase